MEKKWYESKTIWAAILIFVLGLYQFITTKTINIDILMTWCAALGLVGLRQAVDK